MQVIRAQAMGMCFGVRDAIHLTRSVNEPHQVTIFGELVHNEQVNRELAERGFESQAEVDRGLPTTPRVMVTAHGISNWQRNELEQAGLAIIDTTCPLVRRAHDTALRLQSEGWHVVVAGKKNHVEVIGLTGDLEHNTIIETPQGAVTLPHPRIAMICQSTLPPAQAQAIFAALTHANPDSTVKLFDTICRPTRDRQAAVEQLLTQVDALVVVGGRHSNNTRQLVDMADKFHVPALHVTGADELDNNWLRQFRVIGLTAGTSTPDDVIDAVETAIRDTDPARPVPLSSAPTAIQPLTHTRSSKTSSITKNLTGAAQ